MYAAERQRAILHLVRDAGSGDVVALADRFEVTPETVRRDLTLLERQGLLRRVHGGAIPPERFSFEPELTARDAVLGSEKERIARAALAQLPRSGSLILDAGSTTARLAAILPSDRELTVVTNALPIASVLALRPNVSLYLVGGRVRPRTLAAVDAWALRDLGEVNADVAFLGTNGFSVERGLTTVDPAEAAVKRAMLGAARRAVVLADHTKHRNDHFARFGDLDAVDVLVTDTGLEAGVARRIEQAGPEVVLA
jgi:DeoR family transcriptional regulator, fructose operon transcriptional repressor